PLPLPTFPPRRSSDLDSLAARGLRFSRPDEDDRITANRIIMDELVYGRFAPSSIAAFQAIIARLQAKGCDAVALGCTEIPLIIEDRKSTRLNSSHLVI